MGLLQREKRRRRRQQSKTGLERRGFVAERERGAASGRRTDALRAAARPRRGGHGRGGGHDGRGDRGGAPRARRLGVRRRPPQPRRGDAKQDVRGAGCRACRSHMDGRRHRMYLAHLHLHRAPILGCVQRYRKERVVPGVELRIFQIPKFFLRSYKLYMNQVHYYLLLDITK